MHAGHFKGGKTCLQKRTIQSTKMLGFSAWRRSIRQRRGKQQAENKFVIGAAAREIKPERPYFLSQQGIELLDEFPSMTSLKINIAGIQQFRIMKTGRVLHVETDVPRHTVIRIFNSDPETKPIEIQPVYPVWEMRLRYFQVYAPLGMQT